MVHGLRIFLIKGKPVFSTGSRSLDSWIFANLILADELFAKAFVSVNNNLREKLVSSLESPITFDKRNKDTSVAFFISNFNLLSCKLDHYDSRYDRNMGHLLDQWLYNRPNESPFL